MQALAPPPAVRAVGGNFVWSQMQDGQQGRRARARRATEAGGAEPARPVAGRVTPEIGPILRETARSLDQPKTRNDQQKRC
jgi:hypothetical protein